MSRRAGQFDNVIWNAAIVHFTVPEMNNLFKDIKIRFVEGGMLSGYAL